MSGVARSKRKRRRRKKSREKKEREMRKTGQSLERGAGLIGRSYKRTEYRGEETNI